MIVGGGLVLILLDYRQTTYESYKGYSFQVITFILYLKAPKTIHMLLILIVTTKLNIELYTKHEWLWST